MKILVVDDDLELAGLIGYALRQAGYLVVDAADGPSALAAFEREAPSLVILDVNLPRLSGLEVCRQIRAGGSADSHHDADRAQRRGGPGPGPGPGSRRLPDQALQPPHPARPRARPAAARRGVEKPAPLAAGDLTLDLDTSAVSVGGGEPVRLTRLELRLLQILLANAGHTLPAERLLGHVWGSRGAGDRQLLKQLVHRLRQKIEADAGEPRYLVTVSGVGYSLRPTGLQPTGIDSD